ncbi:MAG TPA: biotin/lipoyl-containing protein [Anaeromyxobacteraceae bacterium]|nr:biotin/lipoyl-containing protein [Anaeromyxobacteraceae bacterium]
MSRYLALLGRAKQEEALEVRAVAPGVYDVLVRGTWRRVDAFRHDSGTVSLLIDERSHSVQLDETGSEVKVNVGDSVFPVEVLDERRLRMRRAPARLAPDGRREILAPLPGRVAKVLRKVGDEVREGEGIVVVEALQMQNEMRSPKAGKVIEVLVAEGQTVDRGARLAAVE